jgi:hypothetical protein
MKSRMRIAILSLSAIVGVAACTHISIAVRRGKAPAATEGGIDCSAFRRLRALPEPQDPAEYVVIFDAAARRFDRPVIYTYGERPVWVCLRNADYRMRYSLNATFTDLPAGPSADFRANLQQGKAAPPTPKTVADGGAALGKQLSFVLGGVIGGAVRDTSVLADARTALTTAAAALTATRQALVYRPELADALADIDAAAQEVTGEVPIAAAEASRVRRLLEGARSKIESADLAEEAPASNADLDEVDVALQSLDPNSLSSADQKTLKDLTKWRDNLRDYQQQTAKLQAQNIDKVRQAYAVSADILNHFATVDRNVFPVATDKERLYTLEITASRANLIKQNSGVPTNTPSGSAKAVSPAPGTPGGADGGTSVDSNPSPASPSPEQWRLSYGTASTVANETFHVRSLSYVRLNLGFGVTSLRDAGFSIKTNDIGAQVITHGSDPGVAPLFVLSHYWCGVDLRETQPWHRWNRCGKYNTFIPTIAVAVPLDRNPVQNFFWGAMWSPIPGLGAIGGAHLGNINVLKHGYLDGQPPPVTSVPLNPDDYQERQLRLGWYVGAVLTDALFIALFSKLIPTD